MSRPRVALVHDWLTGMRGGEKVLEAIAELFPRAPIFTLFHFPGTVSETLESHPIHTSYLQHAPRIEQRYRYYLPLYTSAIEDLDLSGFDVVISSSHCVAKSALTASGSTHFCYCHTPMRYLWDQRGAYFSNQRAPVRWPLDWILDRLQEWDAATADRVDHFIANSRFVASRIQSYYEREASVIPPPVDVEFFTPDSQPRDPFVLAVAALSPYKRLERAIGACGQLGLELKVVGTGPESERLQGIQGVNVQFLGRVSAEELRRLYRRAICLVQPGVEDFGITSVEALACGLPVVALAQGGVLDVVRPEIDGVLFHGDDVTSLTAAIDKARRMKFNELNLRSRAETFSRERFRKRLIATLLSKAPGLEGALN
jgi:glycosyltransferase involved in cell wall biosynthesis